MDENDQFKMDGKDELKRHEDKGEMDLWSENQSRHLAPSTPGYSKVVSIVRPFIVFIFDGSVDCFSDHRSISPLSSCRFN